MRQNVSGARWSLFNAILDYRFIAQLRWARGVHILTLASICIPLQKEVGENCNIRYYSLAGRLTYCKSLEKSAINLERDKINNYGPKRHQNFCSDCSVLFPSCILPPTENYRILLYGFVCTLANFNVIQETERLLHEPTCIWKAKVTYCPTAMNSANVNLFCN